MSSDISAILLAGGRSSRLGKDKAKLKLDGRLMLLRDIVRKLSTISDEVIVSTDGRRYDGLDDIEVKWVDDVYPGGGSLVGLYSGLIEAKSDYALVVACDMPFINLELLRYMISLPRDYEALVPRIGNMLEPLHTIYSKKCLETVDRLLEAGHLSILDVFPEVKVRYLTQEEINKYDPQHRSFFNINTSEQLAEAIEFIEGSD